MFKNDEKENKNSQAVTERGSFSAPSLSLPKGGGAIRGMGEKFAANPVTGTGSLSVPIFTSPGRSGFGPQLALSYDSGSGNGPFGFGWSLSLPTITRKTDRGLPKYLDADESDVFILSGAEDLVPVYRQDQAGSLVLDDAGKPEILEDLQNGYLVRRYRPCIEGLFACIERWINSITGEIHWRSISKDNVTMLYGKDDNARVFDPADPDPVHPTRIFSWLVCQSYDDKGNAIIYRYAAENDQAVDYGQPNERNRVRGANRYLKRIIYGNRTPNRDNQGKALDPASLPANNWMFEAVFDYGEHNLDVPTPDEPGIWSRRNDPFSSYRAGFEVRTYRRCRRVLMFHRFTELGNTPCLVRSTEFEYADLDYSQSITIEAELAYWGSTRLASFIRSVTQSGYIRQPDQTYLKKSLPPIEFEYSKASIQDNICELEADSLENLPVGLDGAAYQWVDLDGEGLSGILSEQASTWFYKPNLGGGHFGALQQVARQPSSAALGSGRQQLLDLAGDGQLDLVEFGGAAPGFYERTQNQDWEPFRSFESLPNLSWNDPNLRFVDLNGDGHADVLIAEDQVVTWYPSLAEDGFGPSLRVYQPLDEEKGPRLVFGDDVQSIYLADMCGDGLTDLVRVRNGDVCYWPNLGYGRFGAKVTMDNAPWFDYPDQFSYRRLRLADIDGSGTNDIIYVGRDSVRLYFNQSGNRWSEPRYLRQFPHIDNLSSVMTADLLGNGTACLIWSSPLPGDGRQPVRYIDLMGSQKPHLLTNVTNNLGTETQIEYAPSTKFYLQDKVAGSPWITKLPFPVHCVEKVTLIDHWRKTEFSTRYSYHHGYFDGVEREFRGFGRVEQIDVESYDIFAAGNVNSPYITDDHTLYQPPIKTITWFHTGALLDRQRILKQFEGEYFNNRYPQQSGFAEKPLAEPDLTEWGLSADEWREALRACKGMPLRQEVYELDVDALHDHQQEVPVRIFNAVTHNCHIQCLQPKVNNRHAVFLVTESEALTYHYELALPKPDVTSASLEPDPRIAHTLNLSFDEQGNPKQSIAVVYPRIRTVDMGLLPEQLVPIHAVQREMHVAYTETHYTKDVIVHAVENDPATPVLHHRLRLPFEVLTYELMGLTNPTNHPDPTKRYFTIENLRRLALSTQNGYRPTVPTADQIALHPLEYHEHPKDLTPHQRLVEHGRTLFFDDVDGIVQPKDPLDLGQHGPRGLKYEDYKLALTDALLDAVFNGASGHKLNLLTEGSISARARLNNPKVSGYERLTPGKYWIRSGIAGFAPDAAQHFYLPERYTDAFDNITTIEYDSRDLFIQSSSDARGNTTRITGFDYRVLAPREIEDINGNLTEAYFDILGMVVATAVKGRESEGDNLQGYDFALANPTPAALNSFFDSVTLNENQVRDWLGSATTRFVYHFGEERDNNGKLIKWANRPAGACGIQREKHVANLEDDEESRLQVALECSDGGGNVLMKKVQAEPVLGKTALRWIVSGKTVLNNKGKPVKQYEPYFSHDFGCTEVDQVGVTPIMYYDAAGRLIRTELPDGTFSRVEFSPWHVLSFDANDTVEDSQWYQDRVPNSTATAAEKRAASLAAQHAATPALTILDSLGRDVIAITHNRIPDTGTAWANTPLMDRPWLDERYLTFTKLDAEGKPLWIRDARGNLVMQYITPAKANNDPGNDLPFRIDPATGKRIYSAPSYDIAGNLLYQHSMDAGDRWMLMDAAGKPMLAWDFNQRQVGNNPVNEQRLYFTDYDALHRPTAQWLRVNNDPPQMTERYEYRDAQDNDATARTNNLYGQLVRHYDPSGLVETKSRDFKGNVEEVHRRLNNTPQKSLIDWQGNDPAAKLELETETFVQITEYDALNRMTLHYNWHRGTGSRVAVYKPTYSERGALVSEKLTVRAIKTLGSFSIAADTEQTDAIRDIRYDAKGQKEYLVLGNGTITRYEYDKKTFRLRQLRTTRLKTDEVDPEFPGFASDLKDGRVLQQLHYTYDPVGNITEIYDDAYEPVFFKNQEVLPRSRYTYDALYRLIEAEGRENRALSGAPPHHEGNAEEKDFPIKRIQPSDPKALRIYTQRYHYDAVGNFVEMRHIADGGSWTRTYETDLHSNRLVGTDTGNPLVSTTYQYDTHGNMRNLANGAPQQYVRWDYRDMIASLDLGGANNWAYYQYGAGKQRTRKQIERGGTVEERIYLGGYELYRRYVGNNPVPVEEIESHHLFEGEQRVLLVDDVITSSKGNSAHPRPDGLTVKAQTLFRYQYSNHLGSACLELDHAAEIISYEEYHPYGTSAYRAVKNDIEAPPKRYRYTGMERDEESGLGYHGARYYAPRLGRWISADPSGVADGPNLYAYVAGNPITSSDRHGLQADPQTKPSFASLPPYLQKQILAGQARDDVSDTFATARPQTSFRNINNPDENEEDVVSEVIMGDFYEGPATAEGMASNVTIGIVPFVGQAADLRDILAGMLNVFANPKSPGAYLLLGVAAIALIPGEGDAAKAAFKIFLKERGIKYGSKELDNALKTFVKHDWKTGPLVLAFGETKVAVMEVVNKLKPDKLPMNYELLAKEVKLVQDELNSLLSDAKMTGFKSMVTDALKNREAVSEVSEQVRKSLTPAAEGYAHRHLPDAIISGNALGIAGEVEKRVNSVFGPNSAKIAKKILELPDDVEHFLLNLVLKVK